MARRGGSQHIPRPPFVRGGRPSPWSALAPGDRGFTLADIRFACQRLPEPKRPTELVPGIRAAAVLMPFHERDGEACVVLTKRPETMPSHQGEIAFPGGRHDPEVDATLLGTALREAREEVGLEPSDVEIVAELDTYATVGSRFAITPFVGVVTHPPVLAPEPREVIRILEVPLPELMADGVHREERWAVGLTDRPVHFFELEDETVWGATAAMLAGFLAHLAGLRS